MEAMLGSVSSLECLGDRGRTETPKKVQKKKQQKSTTKGAN